MQHLDEKVQKAIIALDDALCSWERSTGRKSVLILREQGGFMHHSVSGKPEISEDLVDARLVNIEHGIQKIINCYI